MYKIKREELINMTVSKKVAKVIGLRKSIEEARYNMKYSYDDLLVYMSELLLDRLPDELDEWEESLTDEERDELALIEYDEALSEGDRWG